MPGQQKSFFISKLLLYLICIVTELPNSNFHFFHYFYFSLGESNTEGFYF